MPPSALQMPISREPSQALGRNLFRKHVLPVGSITYKGRRIDFSRGYLAKLADHFKAGAFDAVPFLLAKDDNTHTLDPERHRGEIKGFELADHGLDAIIELTDEGAKVVRENPRLGVSARIVEEGMPEVECPRKVPAVEHVLGTLQPRVNGLRDWETVSDLSRSYPAEQVIDLTAATYDDMPGTEADIKLTDEQRAALKDAGIADDKAEAVAKIFAESGSEGTDADRTDADKDQSGLKKLLGKLTGKDSDAEVEAELQKLVNDETPDETKADDKDKEPVALSKEAQAALDLSTATAAEARKEAQAAVRALDEQRFATRKSELLDAGVPPAMVDLAAPLLKGDDEKVIELSSGDKTSPREIVNKLLDEAKGYVDLSTGFGSAVAEGDSQAEEAKQKAEAWDKAEAERKVGAKA